MTTKRHLVLGGARSGKTRFALDEATRLAAERDCGVVYIATAEARDEEMSSRIARHRTERPAHWRTIEAPLRLSDVIASVRSSGVVIVDCLTLWLSNALLTDFDEMHPHAESPTWTLERQAFLSHVSRHAGAIVLVSNEVGSGIVPPSPLARRFQDEQGWLNQEVARICDKVTLMVAGLPLTAKESISASGSR